VYRLFAQAIIYHALGHHADSDAAILELSERYADGGAYQIVENMGRIMALRHAWVRGADHPLHEAAHHP
jgi:hypothetical protein